MSMLGTASPQTCTNRSSATESTIIDDHCRVDPIIAVARSMTPEKHHDTSFFIDYDSLTLADEIGGGASSIVYRGYWHRSPVAIKKWFDPTCDPQTLREFNAELLTIRNLRHPNIVQIFGACGRAPDLCLVMEYLPMSLFDLLHNSRTPIDDRRVVSMAIDIARALLFLHAQSPPIIHRDVKPANFLLDRTWKVKLCDFGLAACDRRQRRAGTVAYMAPELIDPDSPFDASVDVYAFGILLNEMLNRRIPFDGLTEIEIRRRTLDRDRPELAISVDPKLRTLIESCLDHNPSARATFVQIHDQLQRYVQSLPRGG